MTFTRQQNLFSRFRPKNHVNTFFRNTVKQMCAPACRCCRGRRTQRNIANRGMPRNQNGQFCSTYQFRGYKVKSIFHHFTALYFHPTFKLFCLNIFPKIAFYLMEINELKLSTPKFTQNFILRNARSEL